MERKWIIDQIEENTAVLETEGGKTITVNAALLPCSAREGDVLRIVVDRQQTQKKKEEVRNLLQDLFESKE